MFVTVVGGTLVEFASFPLVELDGGLVGWGSVALDPARFGWVVFCPTTSLGVRLLLWVCSNPSTPVDFSTRLVVDVAVGIGVGAVTFALLPRVGAGGVGVGAFPLRTSR